MGRMKLELFAEIVPKTAENFHQFCTGDNRKHARPQGNKGPTAFQEEVMIMFYIQIKLILISIILLL